MKIREAAANIADYLRENKTLTRMLAAFVAGFILGALVF
jgi:hypothetical protein